MVYIKHRKQVRGRIVDQRRAHDDGQELLPLMRRSLEQDLTPSEIGHMEETVKRYGGVDATRGQIRSMQETCYALLDGLEQNRSVSQLRKLVRYLSI